MNKMADVLDDSVESHVSETTFIKRLSTECNLEREEVLSGGETLKKLFRRLKELHEAGLNGVWARIIKNAFAPQFIEPCHYIVGNPPWVNWEHLPDEYRRSTMSLWEHYGLFPKREKAMDTILGAAKYDISMLMTYVAVDKYLRLGGKLGFVLSQSLFKTSGAGQGFRRFMLPDGVPFGPLVVEDMVELKPFEGAANRTAVAVFAKGHAIRYPVSYQYWVKKRKGRGSGIGFDTPYEEVSKELISFRPWQAEPVNAKDITSSWITARGKALKALHKVLGPSDYKAREGVNTGGANAVFWVSITGARPGGSLMISNLTEGARRKVASSQASVESELVYPLLRGSDVNRWRAVPEAHIILTHEKGKRLNAIPIKKMQETYPKTYSYLKKHESILKARKSGVVRSLMEQGLFYSIFALGDYTFAPWKVVWPWISSRVRAAVVGSHEGKTVMPEHNTSFVSFDSRQEADYFCAAFNSAPCEATIIFSYAGGGGGIAAPSVLGRIAIPKYSPKNHLHQSLTELSRAAHKAAAAEDTAEVKQTEDEVDRNAAKLWGLSGEELAEIKRSLEEH
jgi:hypothetical protein